MGAQLAQGGDQRLVVGISGASGAKLGVRALDALRDLEIESHLVVSKAAVTTLADEIGLSVAEVQARADVVHKVGDIGASIASGSFRTLGMIVAPCSVRTLGAIAHGLGDNALTRAADVTLKERRRLVLLVRETPLTLAHLRAMTAVTEMGGIVMPPVPAFYLRPDSIDEIVQHTVARALDLFDVDVPDIPRWGGGDSAAPGASALGTRTNSLRKASR